MKESKSLLILGITLVLLQFLGCAGLKKYGKLEKSARQKYQKGNYDAAVYDCAASLRLNPTYDKAQVLIQDAYRAATNTHQDRIKQLKLSSAKFRWDDMVTECNALIKINQTINNLPTLSDKETKEIIRFEVKDYTEDLTEAKTNAAEAHYQEGLQLSKNKEVDMQKKAAKEFKTVELYSPGYKDTAALYEKSRKAGIKRIAIIPFADKTGKHYRYGAISDRIVDEVIGNIMNDPSASEFLEIVSREHIQQVMQEQKLGLSGLIDEKTAVQLGKILGVHEMLTGQITQVIYTPARTVKKSVKEQAKVVIKTEKYKDEKGKEKKRDVKGTVYANVKIFTRTTGASITGSYKIVDVKTAKFKDTKSFVGKADFATKWATFTGDKRALSYKNRPLVEKGEQLAPVEAEIVNRAVLDLVKSITRSLKAYTS